jgi:ribosomal protein L30/L7E
MNKQETAGHFAVILIRGRIDFKQDVKDTLDMLRLKKKHTCVIVPINPTYQGMIMKVKDAVTWGTVSDETIALLQEKRGSDNKVFHLNSPKGGFERKGIKVAYVNKGALGDRKDNINELIKNML